MDLRVPRWILPPFCAPPHHLVHELLPRGLLLGERAEEAEQLPLGRRIGFCLALVEDLEEGDAEVCARGPLSRLEEGLRALEEDVGGGGPVGGFHVAGGDDAELLVGFVELAFCDSGGG